MIFVLQRFSEKFAYSRDIGIGQDDKANDNEKDFDYDNEKYKIDHINDYL